MESYYLFHRRKFNSTSKYIYKTLFEDGRASDVTVVALGTDWHLHKVYLCQVSGHDDKYIAATLAVHTDHYRELPV